MVNNTIIRDLIASGRKIVEIIPATPMTDTEIQLEGGYSIQCNREEGMGLWRANQDGTYTSFPPRKTAKELFKDLEAAGI